MNEAIIKLIEKEIRDLAVMAQGSTPCVLVSYTTLKRWADTIHSLRAMTLAEAAQAAELAANGHVDLAAPYEAEIARGHAMKCVHAIHKLEKEPKPS